VKPIEAKPGSADDPNRPREIAEELFAQLEFIRSLGPSETSKQAQVSTIICALLTYGSEQTTRAFERAMASVDRVIGAYSRNPGHG
jgi:hypothetical protein